MLNISSWNSPDKLILILWSLIWNHIFNIKLLWRHYDVIFKKVSKTTSLVSKNLPIYIDSELQITLFLVGITKITYFLLIWVKEAKHLIYSWKMGPYLLERRTSCWWRHQNMRNVYYVKSNFFNVKYYVCQIFLCQVSIRLNKRWRNDSYFKTGSFQHFLYSTEKRWRHIDIIVDLIQIFFIAKYSSYPKVVLYKIWVV